MARRRSDTGATVEYVPVITLHIDLNFTLSLNGRVRVYAYLNPFFRGLEIIKKYTQIPN